MSVVVGDVAAAVKDVIEEAAPEIIRIDVVDDNAPAAMPPVPIALSQKPVAAP